MDIDPTQAPEQSQDTPTSAASPTETPAPESTPDSTPAVDPFEQRYNSLRSEFDRRNAALSGQLGHDAQAEALQHFGIEFEMSGEEEPYTEDTEQWVDPDERIDRLETQLQERDQAEQEAEFEYLEQQYIENTISDLQSQAGVDLNAQEKRFVVADALANRLEDGAPDLQGAFAALQEIRTTARDQYLASKRAPKAPVGTAGEENIDFSDPEAKKQFMVEQLEAAGGLEQS